MKGILWFMIGNRDAASSRLQGYLIHEALTDLGYSSRIMFQANAKYVADLPDSVAVPSSVDLSNTVSVIQKLRGPNTDRLIQWLRSRRSRVVYVNCDLEPENHTWRYADTVFTTSEALCQFHKNQGCDDVHVVEEPYEYCHLPVEKSKPDGKLVALWFGQRENWAPLLPWKEIIENEFTDTIRLVTCSDHPDATHRWSIERQKQLMLEADLVILPTISTEAFKIKSPNRLIQSMAVGLPAIVGPLPSYQILRSKLPSIVEAVDDGQFRNALKLMLDEAFRKRTAALNFHFAYDRYSSKSICATWAQQCGLSIPNPYERVRFDRLGKRLEKHFALERRVFALKTKAVKLSNPVWWAKRLGFSL